MKKGGCCFGSFFQGRACYILQINRETGLVDIPNAIGRLSLPDDEFAGQQNNAG